MRAENRTVRLIYGIALSVLTAAVALAFLIAAADIYYGGPDPAGHNYTHAALMSHLPVPLALLGVWIAACAGGFILSVALPVSENSRLRPDEKKALLRLKARMPAEGGEDYRSALRAVRFQERLRLGVWCAALAVCLAGAVYSLVYVLTPAHYSAEDFNTDILRMVKNVMPWVGAGLLLCCAASAVELFSVRSELNAVKTAIRTGDRASVPSPAAARSLTEKQRSAILWGVRAAVGVCAVVLIVAGVLNGGAGDVLSKAINICTECIGLG